MLKVTNKDFEIEENIQLTKIIDGKEEIIYEFVMKITESEMQELKNILFDYSNENILEYLKATSNEKQILEKKAEDEIKRNENKLVDICFKEHKDKFKSLAGEYRFNELVDNIRGFLLNFFMKKQISPLNTTITDLMKITNNLRK